MAEKKTQAEVDDFVANLKKTRSGVFVSETVDGHVTVRTTEGSTYQFEVTAEAKPKAKAKT